MSLLKTTHASSQAAQSAKLRRLGAMGSLKAARHGELAPRKYATGGAVSSGPIEGGPAKPRMDRPGRSKMAKKGGDKGKGATVNIVIAGGAKPGGPPMPPPDAGPPMPPMPPPGAGPGGPPMPPMRAHGGPVGYATGGRIANLGKYAHGGKVQKKADGGETDPEGDKAPKNPGEVSNKESAKYLRGKANSDRLGALGNIVQGGFNSLMAATPPRYREIGKVGKTIKTAAGVAGPPQMAIGAGQIASGGRAAKEAGKFDKDDERKRGGSVKK